LKNKLAASEKASRATKPHQHHAQHNITPIIITHHDFLDTITMNNLVKITSRRYVDET
jgi:hypothetical protein